MQLAAHARMFLARRPWVYWLVVVALATGVGAGVQRQLGAVDEARDRWGERRLVVVADGDHAAGDVLATRTTELPIVAVPPSATATVPRGARARQRIASGEIVVTADLVPPDGPAAGAAPGSVVVAVTDPLARGVRIGLEVHVASEGIVVARDATIVDVVDQLVFVAVDPADAPLVAAAARDDAASLLYVP